MKIKTNSTKHVAIHLIAIIFLASGLYILYTAISPFTRTWLTDPENNSTTRLLTSTEDKIQENRLYIPKIDVNVTYRQGDESTLEHGAWWRKPSNGNPKDGGNFVLSAHRFIMGLTPEQTWRKSPFYNIGDLKTGDEIVVDYEGSRHTYIIEKIHSVAPNAVEIEEATNDDRLTLYSCTLGGSSDGRDVIIARQK